jgi:hypothetical protein
MKIIVFMTKRNYNNNQIVLGLLDNLSKNYTHIITESYFFEDIYTLEKEKEIFGKPTITNDVEKMRLAVLSKEKKLIVGISGKNNIVELINNIDSYYRLHPYYQDREKSDKYKLFTSDQKLISISSPKDLE